MTRATIIYTAMALAVLALLMLHVDRPLAAYMHALGKGGADVILLAKSITDFGKAIWILPGCALAAAACWFGGKKDYARFFLFVFACVALAGLTTDLLKMIFGRARPVLLDQEGIYAFAPFTAHSRWASFPSGHSTNLFAFAFALAWRWPAWTFVFTGAALALAATRWMVAAHYLSDTLGAAVVAAAVTVLVTHLFIRRGWLTPPPA